MNIHKVYARISPRFRSHRLLVFQRELDPPAHARILDVGGTPWFWTMSAPALLPTVAVTLLNRDAATEAAASSAGMQYVPGDACSLPFPDGSFDIVFSNSVIEHVGTWERQERFAAEARRVGGKLWIQTPAREFFIEPHLIAPFIHWLPRGAQRRLIRNATLRGWLERPSLEQVDAFLNEVRLLSFDEMKALFPDCTILRERFAGLTKSYIAVRK